MSSKSSLEGHTIVEDATKDLFEKEEDDDEKSIEEISACIIQRFFRHEIARIKFRSVVFYAIQQSSKKVDASKLKKTYTEKEVKDSYDTPSYQPQSFQQPQSYTDISFLNPFLLHIGGCRFNKKGKNGIKWLIEKKLIPTDSAEDVAKFLLNESCVKESRINKSVLGDYLGHQDEFNKQVLKCFIAQLEFKGLSIFDSLQFLLVHFTLPGEAQKIDRVMEAFAEKFSKDNIEDFPDPDAAYILSFAMIMLNTDLHNPHVSKKMTKPEFIKNHRGSKILDHLSDEYLANVYDQVQEKEIPICDLKFRNLQRLCSCILGCPEKLALPYRSFVVQLQLTEVYDLNETSLFGRHSREAFLFSDILVITKILKHGLKCHYREEYDLVNCVLYTYPKTTYSRHLFTIIETKKDEKGNINKRSSTFDINTKRAKEMFLGLIIDCITECRMIESDEMIEKKGEVSTIMSAKGVDVLNEQVTPMTIGTLARIENFITQHPTPIGKRFSSGGNIDKMNSLSKQNSKAVKKGKRPSMEAAEKHEHEDLVRRQRNEIYGEKNPISSADLDPLASALQITESMDDTESTNNQFDIKFASRTIDLFADMLNASVNQDATVTMDNDVIEELYDTILSIQVRLLSMIRKHKENPLPNIKCYIDLTKLVDKHIKRYQMLIYPLKPSLKALSSSPVTTQRRTKSNTTIS